MSDNIKVSNEVAVESVEKWVYQSLKIPKSLVVLDEDKKDHLKKLVAFCEEGLIRFNEDDKLVVSFGEDEYIVKNRVVMNDQVRLERTNSDIEKLKIMLSILTKRHVAEFNDFEVWKLGVFNCIIPFYF